MTTIFISYSRKNEESINKLATDLEALGHSIWYDQSLDGGQNWWNKILQEIRNRDLFIFALSPDSSESDACRAEYKYAVSLNKSILPVKITEKVPVDAFPTSLSEIQFINYSESSYDSLLRLSRAIQLLPEPNSLPNPLPPEPQVPTSYLAKISARINTSYALNADDQKILFLELKEELENPDKIENNDAINFLHKFKNRPDTLYSIAKEIDELINKNNKKNLLNIRNKLLFIILPILILSIIVLKSILESGTPIVPAGAGAGVAGTGVAGTGVAGTGVAGTGVAAAVQFAEIISCNDDCIDLEPKDLVKIDCNLYADKCLEEAEKLYKFSAIYYDADFNR